MCVDRLQGEVLGLEKAVGKRRPKIAIKTPIKGH